MKIEDILKLSSFDDMRAELIKKPDKKIDDYLKQYDTSQHGVFDTVQRPKKEVKKPDENGNLQTSFVEVARLAVPFQKLITSRAAAFLIGNGIKYTSNAESDGQKTIVKMIQKIWQDSKLDYQTRKLARILFSETEAAELWYFVPEAGIWNWLKTMTGLGQVLYKVRMKILSKSLGDLLYPHFDETGDMDAFSREYSIQDGSKLITRFEIYTALKIYRYEKADSGWTLLKQENNPIGKIPVIYYSQDYPDWKDVQPLIERYETLISNFADTNDYFASPMVKLKGTVSGFASKGESGKVIQLVGEGADADYLTWDQAPEAIKLESEILSNLIFSCTQTPDISFSQMKNLGNLSGIALKMMFLDAHLKSMNKQEIFGECIQRRLNLLKTAIGKVIAIKFEKDSETLELYPEFKFYLPANEKEEIENLMAATGQKPIMSQKSAVKFNPYIDDPEAELQEISNESVGDLGTSFQ